MDRRNMRLLHLSYDPVEKFTLRVPECRLKEEDGVTKRICLASTIEDAINAKPGSAGVLRITQQRRIPLLLYVYEASIPRESLVLPVEVYRKYGVKDAIYNQEYWATEVPAFREYIFVVDSAEFFQHPRFVEPRVKNVKVHKCGERPAFCAQDWVQALNKVLSRQYPTDMLLSQLPWFEKQLRGHQLDVQALLESLPIIKAKAKFSIQ